LFLHIRGRNASNLSPVYFLRKAVKSVLFKATHHLRAKTTKDPLQLVLQVWSDLQMALILCFWNHHAFLARRFYPPCCSGCDSIHALLAGPGHSAMPRRGAENAG
jgi:hypothetical protein